MQFQRFLGYSQRYIKKYDLPVVLGLSPALAFKLSKQSIAIASPHDLMITGTWNSSQCLLRVNDIFRDGASRLVPARVLVYAKRYICRTMRGASP